MDELNHRTDWQQLGQLDAPAYAWIILGVIVVAVVAVGIIRGRRH